MKKSLLVLALLTLAAIMLAGCGGGGGGSNGGNNGGNTGTVSLTSPVSALAVGLTAQLTVRNSSGTAVTLPSSTFTFTSSNPSAATVGTNGLVTAVAANATPVTITATEVSTNKTGTVQITVTAATGANPPTLTAASPTAAVGAGIPLTVKNGSGGTVTLPSSGVTFTSSSNLINVSSAGVASATVPVTGTITVTDASTGKTSTPVTVTFKPALSLRTELITRGDTGSRDIYVLNLDTLGTTRLTNSAAGDGDNVNASPSPDGTSITFSSNRGGNYEIYTTDSDGTNVKKVTSNGAVNETPRFSPNGLMILYSSSAGKTNKLDANGRDLFVIPVAGGTASNLTNTGDGVTNTDPAYSPDGTQIAYSGYATAGLTGNIYKGTLTAAGTAFTGVPTALTTAAFNRWPAFSPGGDKIVYTSNESGTQQLNRINPDGSGKQVLTSDPVLANKPAYLSDGFVEYVSGQTGHLTIFSTNPGSGTSVQLTNTAASDDYPHARLK